MAQDITAYGLVRMALPEPREGHDRTIRPSTHNIRYWNTLVHWSEFEYEVREALKQQQQWTTEVLDHVPVQNNNSSVSPNHLVFEQVCCGDEATLMGRFQARVGQPISAICQSLGLDLRFADFKTGNIDISGKIPDFIGVSRDGTIGFVGEGKTYWAHNIQTEMNRGDSYFRHLIGKWEKSKIGSPITDGLIGTIINRSNIAVHAAKPAKIRLLDELQANDVF